MKWYYKLATVLHNILNSMPTERSHRMQYGPIGGGYYYYYYYNVTVYIHKQIT